MTPSIKRLFGAATPVIFCLLVSGIAIGIANAAEKNLYMGTYTRGTESRGIYVYRFNDED